MANATTPVIQINEGQVGIGTITPTRLLQLNSSGQTDLHLTSTSQGVGASDGMTIFLDSSGTGGLWLREAQSLRFATNSSEKMTILSGGNVGINDTSANFKLAVGGTFGVSDLPFNSSSVSVLVANETIGAELVTNGNFATNSGWTKGTDWTISGGTANAAAVTSDLTQTVSFTLGQTYKLTYTVSNYSAGTLQGNLGAYTVNTPISANGTYTDILTPTNASSNSLLYFYGTTAFTGSISNVSLKEVTSASNQIQKSELNTIPRTNPAASLYDLIPNGAFTTTYAFTSTAGTYAEVMSGNDVITATGTYSVQMLVNDFAVGGTQYDVKYSGVMTWHAGTVNDNGQGAESEIVLHRTGHASNSGITYLRTRETTNTADPGPNELKLEIMGNRTYTAASNVIFKFVRLI